MKTSILILSLVLIAANPVMAQVALSGDSLSAGVHPDRLERIGTVINAEVEAGRIPGAVVLVARNGKVVYHQSFGYSDVKSQTPMRDNNIFRIASMSKAITSVAAMTLYEHGHFRLNDPIANYIPEFADMMVVSEVDEEGDLSVVPATRKIRIIDLLAHTSGISYPFVPSHVQKAYRESGIIDGVTVKDIDLASQMRLLARQPLLFEPGTKFAYGLSTDLLGYLIEVVSKKSLDQYLAEEIFAPLGMHDSHFYLPGDKADRLVTLYAYVKKAGLTVSKGDESDFFLDDPRYPIVGARTYFSGGAGLSSTAYDYGRFLQMLLNDGQLDGTRILSRKSVELMRLARVDWNDDKVPDFGLGFAVVGNLAESGELGSVGSYAWGGAFHTSFWIDPQEHLVGVFMSQSRPANSDIAQKFQTLVYQALE